jgi:hypothetical protein
MLFVEHISLFEEAENLGFNIIQSQFIREIGPQSLPYEQGVRVVRSLNSSVNASKASGTKKKSDCCLFIVCWFMFLGLFVN